MTVEMRKEAIGKLYQIHILLGEMFRLGEENVLSATPEPWQDLSKFVSYVEEYVSQIGLVDGLYFGKEEPNDEWVFWESVREYLGIPPHSDTPSNDLPTMGTVSGRQSPVSSGKRAVDKIKQGKTI